jgi:hypothetical protein
MAKNRQCEQNKDVTYQDAINGSDYIYSWDDVLETVASNPHYSDNEPFFFGSDGSEYTVQDILDILGIDREILP